MLITEPPCSAIQACHASCTNPSAATTLLLVRLGGYSVGVALGDQLQVTSTDRRLVHARHRASGSSSKRFGPGNLKGYGSAT
jgi:hypothetical protein